MVEDEIEQFSEHIVGDAEVLREEAVVVDVGGVGSDYGAEQKVAWGVVGLEDKAVVSVRLW